MLNYMDLQVN